MTITWGAPVYDGSNGFRVGVQFVQSPATVTSATTEVTVTAKVYLWTQYYGSDSSITWAVSGAHPSFVGTSSFSHSSGTAWSSSNITLVGTRDQTFSLIYGAAQSKTTAASVEDIVFIAGKATVTASFTVPARPVSLPPPPSGIVGTRVNDAQTSLTWTNNSSAGAPYDAIEVERYDYDQGYYVRIATLAGSATSYTATGQSSNKQYAYRLRARNAAGNGGYSAAAGAFRTTPAAPSGLTATKQPSGDILVEWDDESGYNDDFQVWHYTDGVLDGAPLGTATGTSYNHAAPSSSVVHKYAVKARSDFIYSSGSRELASSLSAASNQVALLAPPNAPSSLTPNGVARDATELLLLGWQHNPVDTTAQRQRQVQWRVDGGSWTVGSIAADTTPDASFAGGTFTNGSTLEWQVRTWGEHADPSPWSATAIVTMSAKPTATINSPDGITDVATSELTVEWGYFDAEGTTQSGWVATLYDSLGNVLETRSGNDASTTATFTRAVEDGVSYQVGVTVTDGDGVTSTEAVMPFDVAFALPPVPAVELLWLPDDGAVAVTVTTAPAGAGEVDADHVRVFRGVGDGPWALIADGLDPNSTVTDYIPALEATNYYKVVAVSATPTSVESPVAEVVTEGAGAVFVNAGPGFAQTARFRHGVRVGKTPERAKVLEGFAGREWPVEFAGEQRRHVFTLAAALFRPDARPAAESSFWSEVEKVSDFPAPACFRDLEGTRVFVSMGPPSISDTGVGTSRPVAWTLERTDWAEPTG